MLSELFIQNFAIIEELRLSFAPGFNVLTGETGAGKSIILDAMGLVLGDRADTSTIRAGAEKAYVEATFLLPAGGQKTLRELLDTEGLEGDDAHILVISRELREAGRNISRVNGRTVRMNTLREIGDYLVDIHGQGDHLSLLRPRSHLPLLDAYGNLESQRRALAAEVTQLRALEVELASLRQDEANRAKQVELLTYRIEEIDGAKLSPGEEAVLVADRQRLANAEQLMLRATEVVGLLLGNSDDDLAAVDSLGQAERALQQLVRLDDSQAGLLSRLQGLASELSELGAELQAYQEELEFNPRRLDAIEERLDLINGLKRKYGGDIPALLALRERAAADLETIGGQAERIVELEGLARKQRQRLARLAEALSDKRRAAAQSLAGAAINELSELKLEGAQFAVDFAQEPDETGLLVNGAHVAFDATGIDRVSFLISTNPGEPLKPMALVASGGETARLMLALKSVLAQVDATPTLIFDEIDQGIGGRIGAVVGEKLWRLTLGGAHQVIVVTHLPQLAGFGDRHFHVSKHQVAERTITAVSDLIGDGRVQELAAMLGTEESLARQGATSILDQAQSSKRAVLVARGS